jgi:hypothetical protein
VPDSVWEQTGLETLVLADNALTEVSRQIGRLKTLRMRDLGHHKLAEVPETLGELDGLTDFLYLHDNRLSRLPASVGKLTRLRYLNISEIAFEVFPECVSRMSGLIDLRMRAIRCAGCRIPSGNSRDCANFIVGTTCSDHCRNRWGC